MTAKHGRGPNMTDPRNLIALVHYLMIVATDGDYLNDYLTWFPAVVRAAASHLAHVLYWKG